ncbi:hypothetical protein ACWGID_13375 [Kribbella sp. NPDC054772]
MDSEGRRPVFWPFISAVLPLIFGLGVVTTIRLVETGLQGLMYQQAIARIRRYYRSLDMHSLPAASNTSAYSPGT